MTSKNRRNRFSDSRMYTAESSSAKQIPVKVGKSRKKRRIKKSLIRFLTTIAVIISVIMISITSTIKFLTKDIGELNKPLLEGKYGHMEIAKIEEIPQYLQDAVISIEDKRFYSHKGIDLIGLCRAFVKNIITGSSQGGSTLEMQISKNLMTSTEQTFDRKIKDIRVAYEMNKTMSKKDILQVYMNSIYLGRGATGVREGSRIYFAKDITELNLAECAMLAGITKNPSKYTVYLTEDISQDDDISKLQTTLVFNEIYDEENKESSPNMDLANTLLEMGLIDETQYQKMEEGLLVVKKAVLNPDAIERQRVVLSVMKDNKAISKKEYEKALNTNIIIDTSLQ